MYVRIVHDIYELVRCAIGVKVEVFLHQGLTLSPFLFAVVMDWMTDDDRQESVVVMIVVDGTDLFEQVKDILEVCSGETMAYCHIIMLVNTTFCNGNSAIEDAFEVAVLDTQFFLPPPKILYTHLHLQHVGLLHCCCEH